MEFLLAISNLAIQIAEYSINFYIIILFRYCYLNFSLFYLKNDLRSIQTLKIFEEVFYTKCQICRSSKRKRQYKL